MGTLTYLIVEEGNSFKDPTRLLWSEALKARFGLDSADVEYMREGNTVFTDAYAFSMEEE